MPDPYQLDLTSAQINQAVNAAYDSDRQPAAGQVTLCNGDKIAASIAASVGSSVGAEASTRAAADTALDGRVTALEGVTHIGEYTEALVYGATDGEPRSAESTGILNFIDSTSSGQDGFILKDYSLAVVEAGGQLTIPAGTWFVEYSFRVYYAASDGNPAQSASIRVDGVNQVTYQNSFNSNPTSTYFLGGFFVTKVSSWTLDIYWTKGDSAAATAKHLNIEVPPPFFKLRKLA